MKCKIVYTLLFVIILLNRVDAQTYATPDLKIKNPNSIINNEIQNELNDPCIIKLYSENGPYSKYNASSEIINKRTENSKTFQNTDGSFTALMTAGPMHFFENGKWNTSSNEILSDNSLTSYMFSNTHNKFKTYYGNINTGISIKDLVNSYKISGIKLYDATKNEINSVVEINPSINPTLVNSSSVSYNLDSKYSYEIKQFTNKLKSQYIINSNVFTSYDATYFIGFEEILSFAAPVIIKNNSEKNDGVTFFQNDNAILSYSDLFYYSSLRSSSSEQEKADFKVIKVNNTTFKIITFIPVAWLQNSTTTYPVVIDPTVTCTPANSNFWTGTSGSDGTNTNNQIKVGNWDKTAGQEIWRPYAKIDLSSVPDNACISNAVYQMYQTVWTNRSGNDGLRFDIGWANVEPVSASWATISTAIDNLSERYATWDVWGTPGACGGCNGGWDFNEACCGWENFNIDYALFRSRNKNLLCGNYITIGLDMTFWANDCGTCFGDETNELEFAPHSDANRPQLAVTYTNTTAGTPATFGTNQWNVYAYACGNIDLTGSTYAGFYTETSFGYNTTSKWCSTCSPSSTAGYTGACVDIDNHIVVSKRQGFPCGIYQINIPSHDDDARVYINGTNIWEHLGGCCDAHTNIWTGYLGTTSTIEYRHQEGGGGSNQEITFTSVITSLAGGTIAGIANPTSICVGGDPGAFTSSANASGGTVGISNGSPAAPVYQWERAPTNTFATITNVGTNSTVYDPDATLAVGTYFFRRKVTDACGTVAYSNIIQVNVVADPTTPTNTPTPAAGNVCVGAILSIVASGSTGGAGTCNYEYAVDPGTGTYTAFGGTRTVATSGTGTYRIKSRMNCNGTGCDISGETTTSWTVVADPTTPTNTPTPAAGNVCVGAVLKLAASGSTGGAGTCVYEYAIDPGTGTFGAFSTTDSIIASSTGTYRIKSRRNCNGTGCDISSETAATTWTVVADPTAPTNTASPTATTVCVGSVLTLTASGGTGGAGTCIYEYAIDPGTGTYGAFGATNSITASSTGAYRIKSRRNCDGAGCNLSSEVNRLWTVVADPTDPTNTPTPADGSTVCSGTVLSVAASGSTGGAGTCTYQYAIDPGTGTYGAFGATNSITSSTPGVYRIKSRRSCTGTGCDLSGEVTSSWTVVADPTAPVNTESPTAGNVCLGSVLSVTAGGSTGGLGTCIYEYAIDPGTGAYGVYSATNSITPSGTGTYRIKSRRNCDGTGCDISPETTTTWNVFTDPTTPGFTPTPIEVDVCLGTTLSIVGGGSTGGAGTCVYEYAIDPGTGTYGAFGATNSVNPSGTGIYRIKVRRNCDGNACDISGENENSWNVVPQIVAPVLNIATPASGTIICQGQDVDATISAGSGGVGAADVYEYSTDGGSTWAAYGSGATITTSSATTSVQVRVSRTTGTGSGCNATGPTVIATWPVTIQPTLPTINTATPASGTPICQGDMPNVTINAGSGGTGASDVYEYSTDGGATWTAGYISGAGITTSSATTNVQVRVSRTAGTGTGCNATSTNVIATWPIRSGATQVVLADNTTNGATLPLECENGPWTYYADPTDPDKWLFAIEWGVNNAAPKAAAQISIDDLASPIFNEQTRVPYGRTDASYMLSRFWNVNTSALVDPVNVRFYYDSAELTAVQTQRDAKLTALNTALPGSHFPVAFQWFKTIGSPFSASLINDGNNFSFPYVVLTATTGTENGITYAQFNGVTSFSGGTGGYGISPHSSTPLPVTYTALQANAINNDYIQVSWTTASEINNKGFEIWRSADAITFEKIGFVEGNNNSTAVHSYSFDDKNVIKGKEYYYRLNQVDNDGKTEKSNIVSAYLRRSNANMVGEFYPNPTDNTTTIEIAVAQNTTAAIRLVDAMGREVMKLNSDLTVGLNKVTVNINQLAEGMYVANIMIGSELVQKTIVVTK